MARKDPDAQREYMREYRKQRPLAVEDGTKICSRCGEEKHVTLFHKHASGKLGRREACKECTQAQDRLRKFGITAEEYAELTRNGCWICGATESNQRRKGLSVDHCHKTGRVRGALCSKCNTLIGLADDDPEHLEAAIRYILGLPVYDQGFETA